MDSFLTSCSVESGLVHGIGADEESDTEDVVKDDYNNSGMVTENRFSLPFLLKSLSTRAEHLPFWQWLLAQFLLCFLSQNPENM